MIEVLSISFPFYGLIFIGAFLKRIDFLKEKFFYDLSKFTFYLAMPAFIMLAIANTKINKVFRFDFIIYYEIITIIIFIVAALLSKVFFSLNIKESGIFSLNCSYPNYGYIGIPLSIMAFGQDSSLAIALIIFADTIILLSLTSIFVSFNNQNTSLLNHLLFLIKTLFKNPLMLAVIFGAIISLSEVKLNIVLNTFFKILSGAAIPAALISIGGLLFLEKVESYKLKELSLISLFKLIIHPLLIFCIFILFDFENILWIKTAILASCLPVASNVFLISSRYNSYQFESAQSITLSTIISTISIPIVLFLLLNYF